MAPSDKDLALRSIQSFVGPCRDWPEGQLNRCNKPAEYVLWGKLIDAEGLGPRCYDCAAKYVGHRALGSVNDWALIRLKDLASVVVDDLAPEQVNA